MIVSNASSSCARCPGEATTEASGGASGSSPAPSSSPTGHSVVAVCLGCIGTLGFLSNFSVSASFCRYRASRTPMNSSSVSISVSDSSVSVSGTPFSFAASTQGRWSIGRAGCVWYGFINACSGIVSSISSAVLSYERYSTMMAPTIANGRDFRPASGGICFSWSYSVAWTVPPSLGWSRYGPEGPGTTCSVDWKTQTPNNISYIICLFTFCLALPFAVIVYSYGKLSHAIRQVRRVSSVVTRRREQRVSVMVIIMVLCYSVCWSPYGVAASLATFGPRDLSTPEASITPSSSAKFSTVVNPFIYILMNKQFHRCFRAFFSCTAPERGSTLKTISRSTKTLRPTRQERDVQVTAPAPSTAAPTPNSGVHGSSQGANHSGCTSGGTPAASAAVAPKPKVVSVAHYRE